MGWTNLSPASPIPLDLGHAIVTHCIHLCSEPIASRQVSEDDVRYSGTKRPDETSLTPSVKVAN